MKLTVILSPILPFLLNLFTILFSICTAEPIPPVIHTNFVIDLYNDNQIDITTLANYWSITDVVDTSLSRVQYCSDNYILGGPGLIDQDGYFQRTYSSLPTHNNIYFFIRFYIIDYWKVPDLFMIQFDSGTPFTFNPVPAKPFYENNACGDSTIGDLTGFYIQGIVSHSSTTSVTLKIISNTNEASTIASFGFRDISLLFTTSAQTQGACVGLPGTLGVGNCACPAGSYLTGTTCTTCDPSCASCFGGSNTQCYSCKSGYSWDGTKCASCSSIANCKVCSGTNCTLCSPGYLLKWDYTCIAPSACTPPYLIEGDGTYQICTTPCEDNEYMYWDDTCRSSCDFPLDIRIEGSGMFCDYKCSTTQYLKWDGTCAPTCSYSTRKWIWRQFCDLCPAGLVLQIDGSCVKSCDPPLTTITVGTAQKCQQICPAGQYFLVGTTCLSSCTSPLIPTTIMGLAVCSVPCDDPTTEYLYWNGSCLSTCPFYPRTVGTYLFCDPCTAGSFLYQNDSCEATCNSPLTAFTKGGFKECYYPCGRAYQDYNADEYASCSALYVYPYMMTDTGACVLDLDSSEATISSNVAAVLSKFEILLSGIILASIFIIPNDARPICLLLMVKMLEYLKFIEAKYDAKLQQVYNLLQYDEILSSLAPALSLESQQAFSYYRIPDEFQQYGLHSSFLVNSWKPIISIIVILVIMIIVCSAEYCLKDFKFVRWILSVIKPKLNWATVLLFIILTGYFNVFIIYSSIEYRTLHFNSFLSVLSFFIAVFVDVLVIFLIVRLFMAFKEARKAVTQVKDARSSVPTPLPHENEKVKDYLIFLHIASDQNYGKHAFIIICLIRVLLYGVAVGFLFAHPFVQTFFIIFFSVVMIIYLWLQKPLKEWTHTVQFLIMEVVLFVANASAFILSIINATCTYSFTFRGILSDLIIACHFILIICGAGFIISAIVYQLFGERIDEYFKEWRARRELRNKSTRLPDISTSAVHPKPAAVWSTVTPKFEQPIPKPNPKPKGLRNRMDSAAMLNIDETERKRKKETEIELSSANRNESQAKLFSQDSRVMGRHDISYNFTGNDDSRVIRQNFDVRDLETIQHSQQDLPNFDVYTDGENRKQRRVAR